MYPATLHDSGRMIPVTINCITERDASYLKEKDVRISMEVLNGQIIVYGRPSNLNEESEVIIFAGKRNCVDVMSELVETCKGMYKSGSW